MKYVCVVIRTFWQTPKLLCVDHAKWRKRKQFGFNQLWTKIVFCRFFKNKRKSIHLNLKMCASYFRSQWKRFVKLSSVWFIVWFYFYCRLSSTFIYHLWMCILWLIRGYEIELKKKCMVKLFLHVFSVLHQLSISNTYNTSTLLYQKT